MPKYYCVTLLICFIPFFASAQTSFKGRVFEYKTRIALRDVQVQNLTTKQNAFTDEKGWFTINAKPGDRLVLKTFSYLTDTVLITNLREQEIFLVPHMNTLDEVKVTNDTLKLRGGGGFTDPDFHGQTMIYQRDPKTGYYKGGVIFRLWWWKKDEHKRAKLEEQLKEQREQDELNKIFVPAIIGKYVPLKGKDMDDFIALYTPDVKVYYHADFNLAAYLNDCYARYLKLPEDKRHPQKLEEDKP